MTGSDESQPVWSWQGTAKLGKSSLHVLDHEDFQKVQETWGTKHEGFKELHDAYTGVNTKGRKSHIKKATRLKDWVMTSPYLKNVTRMWGDEGVQLAKKMQQMSRSCFISQRATLDGVKFATAELADRSTRDNSYVKESYVDTYTKETVFCYGRISKIIRHQLWPGCPQEDEMILIKCVWFTPLEARNPRNGLVTVVHAPNFTKFSPWVSLKDMHMLNISLWPTYSPDDQDEPSVMEGHFDVVEHGRHVENAADLEENAEDLEASRSPDVDELSDSEEDAAYPRDVEPEVEEDSTSSTSEDTSDEEFSD